jgi:hypothetical protein
VRLNSRKNNCISLFKNTRDVVLSLVFISELQLKVEKHESKYIPFRWTGLPTQNPGWEE